LPLELTIGPDLARPLHPIWSVIEAHAERLDRLARQQVGLTFEPVEAEDGPALAVTVPVAEPGEAVRVLLTDRKVFYFVARDGQTLAVQQTEDRVDRGVYLVLAELAAKAW
jgi:hypothetical protein